MKEKSFISLQDRLISSKILKHLLYKNIFELKAVIFLLLKFLKAMKILFEVLKSAAHSD
jgi:hypothetical protein